MYNEKELKAALESQYNEHTVITHTLTESISGNLTDAELSAGRIESLILSLTSRVYGIHRVGDDECDSVDADRTDLSTLVTDSAKLAGHLKQLGDALEQIVKAI